MIPDVTALNITETRIPADPIETELNDLALRIARITNKKEWKDRIMTGGTFTLGVVLGTLGTALIDEIASKAYEFAVPVIMRQIPIFLSVVVVGIFAIVAFPIIIATHVC